MLKKIFEPVVGGTFAIVVSAGNAAGDVLESVAQATTGHYSFDWLAIIYCIMVGFLGGLGGWIWQTLRKKLGL